MARRIGLSQLEHHGNSTTSRDQSLCMKIQYLGGNGGIPDLVIDLKLRSGWKSLVVRGKEHVLSTMSSIQSKGCVLNLYKESKS